MRKATLILPLLLVACGEPASKYEQMEAPPPVPAPAPVPAADPTPAAGDASAAVEAPLWDVRPDARGVSLVLTESGPSNPGPILQMTCLRDGAFTVRGERLEPVASEERMTVGAGETAVTFVAEPVADETGVQASGRIDPALIDALTVGRRISVNYGAQNVGPFEPPADAVLTRFVQLCREYIDPGMR